MPPILQRLWPPLALLLLVAAYFGPAFAQGLLLAPGDGLAQYFPERVIAAESWKVGEVPFWNPYIFGGMPLLAAIQPGALFPGNAAFLGLTPTLAMNVTVAAAYAIAGIGTYAYVRAIALPASCAMLAAVTFMWSGFMVAHLEHLVMVQSAALLPWLLWAIERFRATLLPRYAQAGAVAIALLIFAGHPQTAAMTGILAAIYALWRAPGLAGRDWARYMGHLFLMGLVGLGVALMQLLPTWELSRAADRATLTFAQLVDHSVPPQHLLTLLFPFFFGGKPMGWLQTPYWGAGPFVNELTGYAGLFPLILAVVALSGLLKERLIRFWLMTAGISLVLAMGDLTPIYRLWADVPLLNAFRIPGRHLMEWDFALAILAALGLARLLAASEVFRWRAAMTGWAVVGFALWGVIGLLVMEGGAIAERLQPYMPPQLNLAAALNPLQPAFIVPLAFWLLAGLTLAGLANRAHGLWAGMVVLVTAADLALFGQFQGWRQLSPRPAAEFTLPPMDAARTLSISAEPYPYHDLERVAALRYPATGALWGTRSIGGYDPLFPSRYGSIMGKMTHGGTFEAADLFAPGHHGLSILGARHLRLDPATLDDTTWKWRLAEGRFVPVEAESGVGVFEDRRPMPRAWRVLTVTTLEAPAVDARVTQDPGFIPETEALVESPLIYGLSGWTRGETTAEAVGINRIRLTTSGEGPGFVVVNEGYDPGWHAYTGGRELPVHRADGLVLGVEVPAGAWVVELRYEPRLWRLGVFGAAVAGLILLLWGLLGLRVKPRQEAAR